MSAKVNRLRARVARLEKVIISSIDMSLKVTTWDRKEKEALGEKITALRDALETCVNRVEELHTDFGLEDNGTVQEARQAITDSL